MARKGSTLATLRSTAPVLKNDAPVLGAPREERRKDQGKFYDRRIWRDGIRPTKLRQDPLCEECRDAGRVVPALEVDHIDGDPENNAPENLRSLCKPCHSKKTARHDGSFGKPVDRSK